MRPAFHLFLGWSLFTVVGCGTRFDAEGLALPFDTLDNAYVTRETYEVDVDEDGTPDVTVVGLGAVLSDRTDLCGAGPLDELSNVFAVEMLALYVGEPDVIQTNAASLDVLFEPEEGDAFVGVRVIQRSGDEVDAELATRGLVDPDFVDRDTQFFVTTRSVANGELRSLGGTMKGSLGADLTDPDPSDVDIDGDGMADFALVEFELKGRVAGAEVCASLDVLP